jgi:hypothetical protein
MAACGQRSLQTVRQWTLAQLGQQLRDLLPAHLLAAEDEGPHSRHRDYPLGLTLQCFLWQILQFNRGTGSQCGFEWETARAQSDRFEV